jgi:hypothetical protein
MAQQTIRFRIHSGGRVQELVEGVQGEGCQQLTERIEARLGSVQQRQSTSEAFLPTAVAQDTALGVVNTLGVANTLGAVPALTQVLTPSSANDTPAA